MDKIRVRFAPSPTGYLHIGGARTALFNWLFARRNGGSFILRIEDTDQKRSTRESYEAILSSLRWLGMDWDEGPDAGGDYGPYAQSERTGYYRDALKRLVNTGKAYYCYCTPEELAARREEARKAGRPPRYDGRCRTLTEDQIAAYEAEGRKPVIRLRVPDEGETVVDDLIRGRVHFENSVLDDLVLMKSDGMPTYNFACVVDDAAMEMSHVIRAEEHLSNTPKQLLIYEALGLKAPKFAHVPMILAPDRSKLSKRHGATSVEEFREDGYLPEAIVNYLALLGWSPGDDREKLSLDEIISMFSFDRVSKTAAIYDVQKLTWLNGHYIRETDPSDLTRLALPFVQKAGLLGDFLAEDEIERLKSILVSMRDRVKTLKEIPEAISYFYRDDYEYEDKGLKKNLLKEGIPELLEEAAGELEAVSPFDLETTEKTYRGIIERKGIKSGTLFHATRLALTGRSVGPGLFDVIVLLGRDESVKRLRRAARMVRQMLEER